MRIWGSCSALGTFISQQSVSAIDYVGLALIRKSVDCNLVMAVSGVECSLLNGLENADGLCSGHHTPRDYIATLLQFPLGI